MKTKTEEIITCKKCKHWEGSYSHYSGHWIVGDCEIINKGEGNTSLVPILLVEAVQDTPFGDIEKDHTKGFYTGADFGCVFGEFISLNEYLKRLADED